MRSQIPAQSRNKRETRTRTLGLLFRRNRFLAGKLFERVHDLQAVDVAGVLHVFGEKYGAAGLLRGTDHEGVPEGEVVEAVQVDGGKNVGNLGRGNVELGEQLNFAAGDGRVYA